MNNALAVLEREPIVVPDIVVSDTQNDVEQMRLIQEAEKVLGYSGPEKHLAEKQTSEMGIRDFLLGLKELCIEPFSRQSVERYKALKLREENSWLTCIPSPLIFVLFWVSIAFFCGTVPFGDFQKGNPLLAVVSATIAIASVFHCLYSCTHRLWRWEHVLIRQYYQRCQQEIPKFVLARAVEIKKRVPAVQIFVEHLTQERQIADPFLVIKYGLLECYIDVWDEPGFETQPIEIPIST